MGKFVDSVKQFERLRRTSAVGESANRRLATSTAPDERQGVLHVMVLKAVPYGNGCICNVEVLSGNITTGQEFPGVLCPSGMYGIGDTTLMFLRDGEQAQLAPAGGTTAAGEEEEEEESGTWEFGVWVEK